KTADEPASSPQRCLRCSVPVPGPESRDTKGHSPNTPVKIRVGELQPDGQVSGGRSDHIAQAPFPDAIETTQTCRQTSDLFQKTGAPELGWPHHFVGGLAVASRCPSAALGRIRSGARD